MTGSIRRQHHFLPRLTPYAPVIISAGLHRSLRTSIRELLKILQVARHHTDSWCCIRRYPTLLQCTSVTLAALRQAFSAARLVSLRSSPSSAPAQHHHKSKCHNQVDSYLPLSRLLKLQDRSHRIDCIGR